jgi:hypothetical protein
MYCILDENEQVDFIKACLFDKKECSFMVGGVMKLLISR